MRGLRPSDVDVDQEFKLKLGFRHAAGDDADTRNAIEGLAVASLWLMCTYGGIGARTRRGFGGVRIVAAESRESGDTLPFLTRGSQPASLLTPDLAYYERLVLPVAGWAGGRVHAVYRRLGGPHEVRPGPDRATGLPRD